MGGFTNLITQKTMLTPSVVKSTLVLMDTFTNQFNKYLTLNNIPCIKMGRPTGSSAHFEVDADDKVYGDIDLQMITKNMPGQSVYQIASTYNKHIDDFINATNPSYIYNQGKPAGGHVIFKSNNDHVQVDLIWSDEKSSDWSRWRVTPERGVKGLIHGNMYSSLGEIMNMSIQTSGVQMKTINGVPVPFSKRKRAVLYTLSTDIENFGVDILCAVYFGTHKTHEGLRFDGELQQYPGLNKADIKVLDLAHTVKGLAYSFQLNNLYGKYNLTEYSNAREFIEAFVHQFTKKAIESKNATKFKKASTPAELKQVHYVQDQIQIGLELVHKAFKLQ